MMEFLILNKTLTISIKDFEENLLFQAKIYPVPKENTKIKNGVNAEQIIRKVSKKVNTFEVSLYTNEKCENIFQILKFQLEEFLSFQKKDNLLLTSISNKDYHKIIMLIAKIERFYHEQENFILKQSNKGILFNNLNVLEKSIVEKLVKEKRLQKITKGGEIMITKGKNIQIFLDLLTNELKKLYKVIECNNGYGSYYDILKLRKDIIIFKNEEIYDDKLFYIGFIVRNKNKYNGEAVEPGFTYYYFIFIDFENDFIYHVRNFPGCPIFHHYHKYLEFIGHELVEIKLEKEKSLKINMDIIKIIKINNKQKLIKDITKTMMIFYQEALKEHYFKED